MSNNLLSKQNAELDKEVKSKLANKINELSAQALPKSSDYSANKLVIEIVQKLKDIELDVAKINVARPTLKNDATTDIDLAFNIAPLLSSGTSADELTNKITSALNQIDLISRVDKAGNYINIHLKYDQFAVNIFNEIAEHKDSYGHFRDSKPLVIVIDYSAPNIAKNMTAGHLRSTIIGQSLISIHRASGNIPFGINHIGDWGTQFGNIIYEYTKELNDRGSIFEEELKSRPTETLMRIYRSFNERKGSDAEALKAGQQIFLDLENGNQDYFKLWLQFRDWSLKEFASTYAKLGISFDAIQGESFYENKLNQVIDEGLSKAVLKKLDNGIVVFPSQPLTDPLTKSANDKIMLDHDGHPKDEVVLKPSGGSVYLTRDLATIRYRSVELEANRILYVTGKEQRTHFLELFNMSDQLSYLKLGQALHIFSGHLNVGGKKMKSREGTITLLNDILDEAVSAAEDMLKDRKKQAGQSDQLNNEEKEIAKQVGISSVIFNDLKQNRERDIEFEPDIAKSVEAGSSAYIQYTNARINSLIKKVGNPSGNVQLPPEGKLSPSEKNLIINLAQFPSVISEAANSNMPHKIATYITEICQIFNIFYGESPIAKADTEIEKNFRLHLSGAVRQIIKNASALLHLQLPEKM